MKKQKQPGENISLKTKKNESPAIMEWINCQSNLMDSIRYLIENEIKLNGVRNLQLLIPSDRSQLLAAVSISAASEIAAAAQPAAVTLEVAAVAVEEPVEEPVEEIVAEEEEEIDEEDIESWI